LLEPASAAAAGELVTAARRLGTVIGLVLARDAESGSAALVDALGAHGVSRVLRAVPDADPLAPAVVAECVVAAVRASDDVVAVLAPASPAFHEVAGRVAVATRGAVVTDVEDVTVADGTLRVAKQVLAGAWTSTVEVTATPVTLTLKPRAIKADEVPPVSPEVVDLPVACGPAARAARVTQTVHQATGRPPLTSADVVVVAGRGVDRQMSLVTDLADELGAAVGATRVVVDEGWADHDLLVGQTGVSVAPRLYIGAGVSGQVHHRGGMQAASTVVAINTDPDAPIFEHADYGIVGDVAKVLPQLTTELHRLRS